MSSGFEAIFMGLRRGIYRAHRAGRTIGLAAGFLTLALVAAGCVDDPADSTGPEPGSDGTPITLAAAISETGRHGVEGIEVVRGYRLAVEILNEKGGIRGRPVQLEIRDDGSDAQASARLYEEFTASGAVDALLGPYSSPITETVLAVNEAAGVPMVAPMAAAPSIWSERQRQWSVQLLTPGPAYLQGSVEVAVFGGAQTVAIVYENSAFPASVVEGVREAVRGHGLEIVMDRSYEVGAADHEAIAAAARDAGADLFIGGGYTADAAGFAAAAPAVGYRPVLMSLIIGPGQQHFVEDVGAGRPVRRRQLAVAPGPPDGRLHRGQRNLRQPLPGGARNDARLPCGGRLRGRGTPGRRARPDGRRAGRNQPRRAPRLPVLGSDRDHRGSVRGRPHRRRGGRRPARAQGVAGPVAGRRRRRARPPDRPPLGRRQRGPLLHALKAARWTSR
ncbi:MAG: ABC transporter substrate-binding protein [Gemmatimonadales bacterium]|nr:ABC transporter substrate-binding protein [Gemmatimonadales bacterium]